MTYRKVWEENSGQNYCVKIELTDTLGYKISSGDWKIIQRLHSMITDIIVEYDKKEG